jgi:hypothetical protein
MVAISAESGMRFPLIGCGFAAFFIQSGMAALGYPKGVLSSLLFSVARSILVNFFTPQAFLAFGFSIQEYPTRSAS